MTESERVPVVLRGFPMRVAREAYRHREALLREFAIIAHGGGENADIPKRLLEIMELFEDRYADLNPEAQDFVEAAVARGENQVDLALEIPLSFRDDTLELAPILFEVDEYCRSGALLTLAPPEHVRAFWVWFLREFVRQANGEPATPWPEFRLEI